MQGYEWDRVKVNDRGIRSVHCYSKTKSFTFHFRPTKGFLPARFWANNHYACGGPIPPDALQRKAAKLLEVGSTPFDYGR